MKKIYIVNSLGQRELFSWRKVFRGARGAGAPKLLAAKIADAIEEGAYSDMPTQEIFSRVRQMLLHQYPRGGIRYSLKEAMRRLGPSGFPFEKYTADILEQLGFSVKVGQIIKGKCVFHEVDFIAKKEGQLLAGECKFHHLPGERVNIKVALAHYARFLDLQAGDSLKEKFNGVALRPIIVTNTKFTSEAVKYGQCQAMDLLGWKYPLGEGLEHTIESKNLYPVTILPSLKRNLLELLSREQMMLAQDLLSVEPLQFAKKFGVPEKYISVLKREAEILLEDI